MVAGGKSGCPFLDFFKLFDMHLVVRVPNAATIFQDRPNVGVIGGCLNNNNNNGIYIALSLK